MQLDDNKDQEKERDKEKDTNPKDNKEKVSLERKDSVSEDKDSGSEKVVSEIKENSQSLVPGPSFPVQQHESHASMEEKRSKANTSATSESSNEPPQEKTAEL